MANLGEGFNAADMPEGQGNFEPIPAGWYNVTIQKADLRDTKDGTGQYINIQFSVTGPSYEGRVVFGMINIRNKSQKAEEIGRQQLGDLMRSLGIGRLTDTDQLIGGSCQIKVKIQEQEGYDPKNTVSAFKAIEGSSAPLPVTKEGGSVGGGGNTPPPWARK